MSDTLSNELKDFANTSSITDLHLTVGQPPTARINGILKPLRKTPLSPEEVEKVAKDIIPKSLHRSFFSHKKSVDFSVALADKGRFRVNAYYQRGNIALALRLLPLEIPKFEELMLPSVVRELSEKKRGLVMVTGPTGSGKSTTLAAMVDYINSQFSYHIVTLEDPIEYVIEPKKSFISQRELGTDFSSFEEGLRAALRQDPDIIVLGEMRDKASISVALTLAETGHLVLTTLHTKSAGETVSRITDVFSPEQQDEIRVQLSTVLEGIIAQRLLPKKDNSGLTLAYEILIATPAIRSLIRDNKPHLIPTSIQTGVGVGMISMEQRLVEMVRMGLIDEETALANANYPDTFSRMLHGNGATTFSALKYRQ
jgi:twitching motility protein PilT